MQSNFLAFDINSVFEYLYDKKSKIKQNFNFDNLLNVVDAIRYGYEVSNEPEIDIELEEIKFQYGTNGLEYALFFKKKKKKINEMLGK